MQRVVDVLLPQLVFFGCAVGVCEGGRGRERLRERPDLRGEEGEFEVDDGGWCVCHFGVVLFICV